MRHSLPFQMRIFDLTVVALTTVFVVPVLLFCIVGILWSDGRPVFYKSRRRVFRQQSMPIVKFRTMRRDAEKIANRNTVAIEKTRFLNIGIDSPLYTPVGRWIERLMLTELPQIIHVLQGRMTLVGNRPLPENVISSLREEFPTMEARFDVPTGLTGPVQLIGREAISDRDRLRLEFAYCDKVLNSYSFLLDFKILFFTVIAGLLPNGRFSVQQVEQLLTPRRRASHSKAAVLSDGRRKGL